jgi:hypothetical protein
LLRNPSGKNGWIFEPTFGLIYFGRPIGMEASLFAGQCFNTENPYTGYRSGIQAHLDGNLAQHFPLLGWAGRGRGSGFRYRQIADNRSDGADLGGFKARVHGIGPVLSFAIKLPAGI